MSRSLIYLGCVASLSLLLGCQSKPICVLYPTHQEQVSISDVPTDIVDAFHRACPDARLVSVSRELGGKDGRQFIFWVFRFEQDGKLREDLITRATDKPYICDVQN